MGAGAGSVAIFTPAFSKTVFRSNPFTLAASLNFCSSSSALRPLLLEDASDPEAELAGERLLNFFVGGVMYPPVSGA